MTCSGRLYEEYQSHLKVYNAVDFDDLIMLPIKILKNYPDVLEEYRAPLPLPHG